MKLILSLLTVLALLSCNQSSQPGAERSNDSNTVETAADDVPLERATVKAEPVATFTEKVENPLNNWRFQVKLFETPQTFRYLMKMEYEEMREQDTLKIPNLGFEPKLEIRKGSEQYSCIIGFIDNKNQFREYKKVAAKNNNLKVTTLKRYGVYLKAKE